MAARFRFSVLSCLAILACNGVVAAPKVFIAGSASTVSVFQTQGLPVSVVFSAAGTTAYVAAGRIYATNAATHQRFSSAGARFHKQNVGRPFQAADPLSSGSCRLKAGCGQDCPPH